MLAFTYLTDLLLRAPTPRHARTHGPRLMHRRRSPDGIVGTLLDFQTEQWRRVERLGWCWGWGWRNGGTCATTVQAWKWSLSILRLVVASGAFELPFFLFLGRCSESALASDTQQH